jgi:pimeloyl-ACP methyl ester carboxylesterase
MHHPDAMPIPTALQPYSRTIAAGGPWLHYYDAGAGAGPPLVLIHGLGDEADTWRHVLPLLAARRRVITPDLPGFGRSDKPHRAYTTAFFARTIAALMAELGIARAELAGSSMGAVVAQRLALARPALVERLILIGGGMALAAFPPPPPPPPPRHSGCSCCRAWAS